MEGRIRRLERHAQHLLTEVSAQRARSVGSVTRGRLEEVADELARQLDEVEGELRDLYRAIEGDEG